MSSFWITSAGINPWYTIQEISSRIWLTLSPVCVFLCERLTFICPENGTILDTKELWLPERTRCKMNPNVNCDDMSVMSGPVLNLRKQIKLNVTHCNPAPKSCLPTTNKYQKKKKKKKNAEEVCCLVVWRNETFRFSIDFCGISAESWRLY